MGSMPVWCSSLSSKPFLCDFFFPVIFSVFTMLCNHHHSFQNVPSPQKETYSLLAVSPLSPAPGDKKVIYFCYLFWVFHINGVMQFVAFGSNFFHMAQVKSFQGSSGLEQVSVLHSILVLGMDHILQIYSSVDGLWVASPFGLLGMFLCTFVYQFLSGCVFSVT